MKPKGPSPAIVFETVNAYQRSEALKAAVELDLFTHIAFAIADGFGAFEAAVVYVANGGDGEILGFGRFTRPPRWPVPMLPQPITAMRTRSLAPSTWPAESAKAPEATKVRRVMLIVCPGEWSPELRICLREARHRDEPSLRWRQSPPHDFQVRLVVLAPPGIRRDERAVPELHGRPEATALSRADRRSRLQHQPVPSEVER